jgi:hypothetical protein
MALGDRRLLPYLDEVAAQLRDDLQRVHVRSFRRRGRRGLTGSIDGFRAVYQLIGGEGGGAWHITVEGAPIESLRDLLRASVVKRSDRWVEKRSTQHRVIPTRSLRPSVQSAWVTGADRSALLVAAKNQETLTTLATAGIADLLLAVPPPAQYFPSGRLDAQMPRRFWGFPSALEVSERIQACVGAVARLRP